MKHLVFDMGGVLIDWRPYESYKNFMSLEEFNNFVDFITPYNAICDAGCSFEIMKSYLYMNHGDKAREIKIWFDDSLEMIKGPIKESVDLLKDLKSLGYPLYGISNWSRENFPQSRGEFEFLKYFTDIVVSGHAQMIKPGLDIYKLFLKRNSLFASDCIFIDDRKENVDASIKVGMDGIIFENAKQLRSCLAERGLKV